MLIYAMNMECDLTGNTSTVQGFGLSPVPVGSEAERAGLTRPLSSGCSASMVGDQASTHVQTTGIDREGGFFPPLPVIGNEKEDNYPRFLLVEKKEGDFSKVSPFVIHKALFGLIGKVEEIKKVKGLLFIKTVSNKQSKRLLEVKRLCNFDVQVKPHDTLNLTKGVIYCSDLMNCSEEEILEGLEGENVVAVKRIRTKVGGTFIDTPNLILTFNATQLPRVINAAFYTLKVRPYVPQPMRCYKCQRFGHTTLRCENEQDVSVENLCIRVHRVTIQLYASIAKANILQTREHVKYIKELQIQEIKVTRKVSYPEAKRMLGSAVISNISYSSVATHLATDTQPNLVSEIRKIVKDEIKELTSTLVEYVKQSMPKPNVIPSPIELEPHGISEGERTTIRPKSGRIENLFHHSHLTDAELVDKRKRDEDSSVPSSPILDEEALDVERKQFLQQKKKKGWPKGKPRKNSS